MLKIFAVNCLVVLFLQPFFGSVGYAKPIKLKAQNGEIRYRSEFPVSGIVNLPDNNLLIWNWQGKAQVLTIPGKLSAVFKLPSNVDLGQQVELLNIIPDTGGFLINARIDQKSVVLLSDKNGKLIEQWYLPSVLSLSSEQGVRKAYTNEGVFRLNEKGLTEHVGFSFRINGSIKVFTDKKILCTEGDLSKLNQRPIVCKKLVDSAKDFQVFGTLAFPPVCAESLLIWGVGKQEHSLVIYALENGKKVSEKSFSTGSYPKLVCDSQTNSLLVGNNGIEIYTIPGLKKTWSYPLKKGKVVTNIALLEKFIAIEEEDAGEVDSVVSDIVLVPLPRIFPYN